MSVNQQKAAGPIPQSSFSTTDKGARFNPAWWNKVKSLRLITIFFATLTVFAVGFIGYLLHEINSNPDSDSHQQIITQVSPTTITATHYQTDTQTLYNTVSTTVTATVPATTITQTEVQNTTTTVTQPGSNTTETITETAQPTTVPTAVSTSAVNSATPLSTESTTAP